MRPNVLTYRENPFPGSNRDHGSYAANIPTRSLSIRTGCWMLRSAKTARGQSFKTFRLAFLRRIKTSISWDSWDWSRVRNGNGNQSEGKGSNVRKKGIEAVSSVTTTITIIPVNLYISLFVSCPFISHFSISISSRACSYWQQQSQSFPLICMSLSLSHVPLFLISLSLSHQVRVCTDNNNHNHSR